MFLQLSCVFVNAGEQENIDKFTKRLVKVTKQHNDECKKLLTLMGVPFVEVGINAFSQKNVVLFHHNSRYWGKWLFKGSQRMFFLLRHTHTQCLHSIIFLLHSQKKRLIPWILFCETGSVWSWGQLCRPGKIGKSLCYSDGRYGRTNVWDKCSAQTSDSQRSKVNTEPSQCYCQFLVFRHSIHCSAANWNS